MWLYRVGLIDSVDFGRTISGDRDFPISFLLVHSAKQFRLQMIVQLIVVIFCYGKLLVSVVLRVFVFVISDFT